MASEADRNGGWAAMSGRRPEPDRGDAGWRPDPEGRFEQRFHDGSGWTPRVRVGGAVAIDTSENSRNDERWYPDPTGRFDQRMFVDGRWSKRVRVGPAVAIDTKGVKAGQLAPRGAPPAATTSSEREPGWYPDPRPRTDDGRDWWDPRPDLQERERYWDGFQWTAKVRRPGGRRERAPARLFMSRALMILAAVAVVVLAVVAAWIVLA